MMKEIPITKDESLMTQGVRKPPLGFWRLVPFVIGHGGLDIPKNA